ncbi:MAG: hypothetical protein IPF58_12455 [Saprospirales bacterium]|nr:hypothetical protein [Saprospirales bacterium]
MNSHEPCIIQSGFINNIGAFFNDELLLKNDSNDFETFTNNLYKQLDIKYPKFYKMDNLCKIGFLASEIALKNIDLHQNTVLIKLEFIS